MKPNEKVNAKILQLLTHLWNFICFYIWTPILHLFAPPKAPNSEPLAVKPTSAIPGPCEWPVLGDALKLKKVGGPEKLLDYVAQMHQKYGHIFKTKLGHTKFVFIDDPILYKEVIRQEPRCPQSMKLPASVALVKTHNLTRGLFFQNGEDWYQGRNYLTQLLLKNTGSFMETVCNCTETVLQARMEKWTSLSMLNSGVITDIEQECYETFLSMILAITFGPNYKKYLSMVQLDETNLAKVARELLTETFLLNSYPIEIAQALGLNCWKRYEEYTLYNINKGRELTDVVLAAMTNSEDGGSLEEFGLLHRMKSLFNSVDDIRTHCTDFTLDISDPVSITLLWSLQALGRNLQVQDKIFAEIESVCEPNTCVQYGDTEKMPYLKATCKEVFRMYPTAYLIIRQLEKEMVIGGYKVSPDYLVTLSTYLSQRNPENFSEPEIFKPERWINVESSSDALNTHAYHPFGIGKRECVGKGVATAIVRLFVASVVQKFVIESEQQVEPKTKIVLLPDKDVKIKFRPRDHILV